MNLSPTIARAGPWLVALAPAYFVFDTLTGKPYTVPGWMAFLIAVGVETTGVAAFHTFSRLYSWNRKKRKRDPAAPLWIALLLVIGYVGSGLILTAVLKGDWTLGLFFLLAAVGYGGIALNIDQDAREKEAVEAAAARKRTFAGRPPDKDHPPGHPQSAEHPPEPFEHSPEYDELLRTVADALERSEMSEFSPADVQDWTGRKRTTAYELLNYGELSGVIQKVGRGRYVYRNGKEPDNGHVH